MSHKQEAIVGLIAVVLWIGSYGAFLITHLGILWVLIIVGVIVDLVLRIRSIRFHREQAPKQ